MVKIKSLFNDESKNEEKSGSSKTLGKKVSLFHIGKRMSRGNSKENNKSKVLINPSCSSKTYTPKSKKALNNAHSKKSSVAITPMNSYKGQDDNKNYGLDNFYSQSLNNSKDNIKILVLNDNKNASGLKSKLLSKKDDIIDINLRSSITGFSEFLPYQNRETDDRKNYDEEKDVVEHLDTNEIILKKRPSRRKNITQENKGKEFDENKEGKKGENDEEFYEDDNYLEMLSIILIYV